MRRHGDRMIPNINLDTEHIPYKAEGNPDTLPFTSSLSGVSYIASKDGEILIMSKHCFFRRDKDDLRVIREELGYVIDCLESWMRS